MTTLAWGQRGRIGGLVCLPTLSYNSTEDRDPFLNLSTLRTTMIWEPAPVCKATESCFLCGERWPTVCGCIAVTSSSDGCDPGVWWSKQGRGGCLWSGNAIDPGLGMELCVSHTSGIAFRNGGHSDAQTLGSPRFNKISPEGSLDPWNSVRFRVTWRKSEMEIYLGSGYVALRI